MGEQAANPLAEKPDIIDSGDQPETEKKRADADGEPSADEPGAKRFKSEGASAKGGPSSAPPNKEVSCITVFSMLSGVLSILCAQGPGKHGLYISRDEVAKGEEAQGKLNFRVIENDGKPQHSIQVGAMLAAP
jgi:hypothetical protein